MKQFIHSLTFKVGVVIIATEILVLSVSGYVLYGRFSEEIDRRIETQVQLPGKLMNSGQLRLDAIADQVIMQELVGEELLEGMVIGTNQIIFYSLNPEYVGQDASQPGLPAVLFDLNNPQSILLYEPNNVISVAPIYGTDGRTLRFFIYVKVGTAAAQAARAELITIFLLSTAVTVLATSLIILLSFHFMIFSRLAGILRVLERVEAGDLTARTGVHHPADEIGGLQRRVDDVTSQLEHMVGILQESEERYRMLVENAPYGVSIFQNDQIVYANRAAVAFTGASSAEQLIGTSIWDYVPVEYHDSSRERIQQVLNGNTSLPLRELKYIRLDGISIDVEAVTIPFVYEGKPAAQTVYRDISERKQAQEQLQAYAGELERRNQELQNFAYISSHDLQEPLRKIQTFGDRLQARYGQLLDERGQDYLQRMQGAANRMQTLILDLLSFSRVTTHGRPFEPVHLQKIIQEALADLGLMLEETKGQVSVGELPTIEADPNQMRQLFQNLLNNALKFHQDAAPPIVQVQAEPSPEPDGMCRIIVRDNGIGFEQKYGERIFEMFQRLHGRTSYEGTGIGLAVCRKIVERHQGHITADSTPGQGSTFIVTLPIKQAEVSSNR